MKMLESVVTNKNYLINYKQEYTGIRWKRLLGVIR